MLTTPCKGTLLRYKDGRIFTFERETWFASTHGPINKMYVAVWVDKGSGAMERFEKEAKEWEVVDAAIADEGSIASRDSDATGL